MQKQTVDFSSDFSINVPDFPIPVFDEHFSKWVEFSEIFQLSIDNFTRLTDVERLKYLKLSFKGEAARVIQNFSICSVDGFATAW